VCNVRNCECGINGRNEKSIHRICVRHECVIEWRKTLVCIRHVSKGTKVSENVVYIFRGSVYVFQGNDSVKAVMINVCIYKTKCVCVCPECVCVGEAYVF